MGEQQELDEQREAFTIDLFAEVRQRSTAADKGFPFEVEERKDVFRLRKKPWPPGCYAYLFGMFSTEATFGRYLDKNFFTSDERKEIPELLQIVSTIAAAGYVKGTASG